MPTHFDVIVVGGGAIGSAIAWRLGQTGRHVLLLEKKTVGAEASSAAAGMLGAQLEVAEPGAFYQLCLESRALYPSFADELREETGIDIQYARNGILRLIRSATDVSEAKATIAWQADGGERAEWLSGDEVARLEPGLASALGAIWLPDDGNVSAPALVRALGVAASKVATVVEGTDVVDVRTTPEYARVRTRTETYTADQVVVAAGAWADELLRTNGIRFGIQPVKGQLFALRPRDGIHLTRTAVDGHLYIVPKQDGSLLVGATQEPDAGFDRDVTILGLNSLFEALKKTAPGLVDARFERAWVGLRPVSAAGRPAIGEIPNRPRLHVAVGHFRNGILLTPLTARMVTHYLVGGRPVSRWSTFLPVHTVHQTMEGFVQ